MMNTGRPTKLTPEIQAAVVNSITAGNYQCVACESAGIGKSTFHEWLNKGSEGQQPYADFADAVKRAEADAERARVARIASAGVNGTWQADAWYLERRYPDRWGLKQKHEYSTADGKPMQVSTTLAILGDPKACELANALIARLSGGEEDIPDETQPTDETTEA